MKNLLLIVAVAIIGYFWVFGGSCTFPWQSASDGSSCGGRSALSR